MDENASIAKAVQELKRELELLHREYDKLQQEHMQKAMAIRKMRQSVLWLCEGVVGATKNTPVGAAECKAALDSAARKLDKAANKLHR